jgi:Transposase IS66 family
MKRPLTGNWLWVSSPVRQPLRSLPEYAHVVGFGDSDTPTSTDETLVAVLDRGVLRAVPAKDEAGPDDGRPAAAGSPHVMIVRTPDERLTLLQAIASRRKDAIAGALPGPFTGTLITDGYPGYQHLLSKLAAIQQCCQHVIRRCRAVAKLGPRTLQSWAENVIAVLRDAHRAVEEARAAVPPPWPRRSSRACGNTTTGPFPPGSSTTG